MRLHVELKTVLAFDLIWLSLALKLVYAFEKWIQECLGYVPHNNYKSLLALYYTM